MEIRQIRSFLSVAETLHFGRSARLLHLSQPALSLQIKSLEDELGLELLKRNRQGTILTEAGRVFRDSAAIALEQLEAATRKAQWASSGKLGRIRIGFISTAGHEIVPNRFRCEVGVRQHCGRAESIMSEPVNQRYAAIPNSSAMKSA